MSKITPPPAMTDEQIGALYREAQMSNANIMLRNDYERGVCDGAAARDEQWQALLAQQEPAVYQFQDKDGNWHGFHSEKHYRDTLEDGRWPIRALYAAPVVQQAVPAGWKLVPVEPTEEMLAAYVHKQGRYSSSRSYWAAMLAAAPEQLPCEFPACAVHHICTRPCERNSPKEQP